MMHEFTHWPKPYLRLSATCDEILSWMTKIWMKNNLVSDSNCNTIKSIIPQILQDMTNNVGLKLVLMTLYRKLQLVLRKTIRIGDTKYHLKCSFW